MNTFVMEHLYLFTLLIVILISSVMEVIMKALEKR